MQREIKYRAKGQTDGIWHYGLLVLLTDTVCHIKDKFTTWICDAETVGQYTGLKDKNGKEICEGDIVPYHFNKNVVGVVRYGEYSNAFDDSHAGHIGFYVEWDKDNRDILRVDLGYWVKASEVTGNIHDNPELLT